MKTRTREAWFRRTFLWGSMPIHWKGVLVLVLGILSAVGIATTGLVLAQYGHPILFGLCFGLAFCSALAVFIIAELHMERK